MTPAKLARIRRTLGTAAYGSAKLLDAVEVACVAGGKLEAVMERRLAAEVLRVAEQDQQDAVDLARHWPSSFRSVVHESYGTFIHYREVA